MKKFLCIGLIVCKTTFAAATWEKILVVGFDLKEGNARTVVYPSSSLEKFRDSDHCTYRDYSAGSLPPNIDPSSIKSEYKTYEFPSRIFTKQGKVEWVQFSHHNVGGPSSDKKHFLSSMYTDFNLATPNKPSHVWFYWKVDGSSTRQSEDLEDLWFLILEGKCD